MVGIFNISNLFFQIYCSCVPIFQLWSDLFLTLTTFSTKLGMNDLGITTSFYIRIDIDMVSHWNEINHKYVIRYGMRLGTGMQNFLNILLFISKIFAWCNTLLQPCIWDLEYFFDSKITLERFAFLHWKSLY